MTVETKVDFETAFNVFMEQIETINHLYMDRNFPNNPKDDFTTNNGQTYRKVMRGGSVHCFVAVIDGSSKKLGNFEAGDVFKADGAKGPAKGVRGNIFDDNHGIARMGPYGPAYN